MEADLLRLGRFPAPLEALELAHMEDLSTEDKEENLVVDQVDFDVRENSIGHHTFNYKFEEEENKPLVVRRGQEFRIHVTFNREYNPVLDHVWFLFSTGKLPVETKGTKVNLKVGEAFKEKRWMVRVLESNQQKVTFLFMTPPTCFVGQWKLIIDTQFSPDASGGTRRYSHNQPLFILYNPWCKDDQVYHPNPELLIEYVLNDTGKIYVGNSQSMVGRPWVYGQFEAGVLQGLLEAMQWSKFPAYNMGDPVKVSRHLSALVNANDDNGFVIGNWSGNYTGGTAPYIWTGSTAILKEFFKAKQSVRFGQCWVFAGVLTTCLRALGIPTRTVSNFQSAHDSDGSVSIDKHYDFQGYPIERLNRDSIWNFHVWNDAWMTRPDLEYKYGGWQACDATPQETSERIFQCGPFPVEAVKQGDIKLLYDGPFIFAEVNADQIRWIQTRDGRKFVVYDIESKDGVGQKMSTKRPTPDLEADDPWRQDVTDDYKYPEGSPEERVTVIRANLAGTRARLYDQPEPKDEDVKITLLPQDNILFGKHCTVEVTVKNISDADRFIRGSLNLSSVYSTGVIANDVKMEHYEEKLSSNEEKTLTMTLEYKDYSPKAVDDCFFRVTSVFLVDDTNQIHLKEKSFRMLKPDLDVEGRTKLTPGQEGAFLISFVNPLPVELTDCEVYIEVAGLKERTLLENAPRTVKPSEKFQTTFTLKGYTEKQYTIVAVFNSIELAHVLGETNFLIESK